MKPVTKAFILRLAYELNEWSKRDDSLIFRDFYDSRDIPHDAFHRWINKYPELKAAHQAAKGRLGSRREKGALTRKFDGSIVTSSMPMYDPEWKDFMAWKASLKDNEKSNQKVVVEINDITKSIDTSYE